MFTSKSLSTPNTPKTSRRKKKNLLLGHVRQCTQTEESVTDNERWKTITTTSDEIGNIPTVDDKKEKKK